MTDQPKPFRVRPGGLMRCCHMELGERAADPPADEGEELVCKWCRSPMRFRDGAWEWARSPFLGGASTDAKAR